MCKQIIYPKNAGVNTFTKKAKIRQVSMIFAGVLQKSLANGNINFEISTSYLEENYDEARAEGFGYFENHSG